MQTRQEFLWIGWHKMRLLKYLKELATFKKKNTYWHVTEKKNLSKIKKTGIKSMKKPSHPGAFGQDVRDDPQSVYAFNDKMEAFATAFSMNWNEDPKNEVVIIEFTDSGKWEKDTHFQATMTSRKGSWVRRRTTIEPSQIKKVISQKEAFETIRELNLAGKWS